MAGKKPVGCARPTGTVVGAEAQNEVSGSVEEKEVEKMGITVGGKAPDFEAPAYYKGEFTSVKLADYLGKWVLLCFYPGDFTFV